MTMFEIAHMVDLLTSFDWWDAEPHTTSWWTDRTAA